MLFSEPRAFQPLEEHQARSRLATLLLQDRDGSRAVIEDVWSSLHTNSMSIT